MELACSLVYVLGSRDVDELKGPLVDAARNMREECVAVLGELKRQQENSRTMILDFQQLVQDRPPSRAVTAFRERILLPENRNKALPPRLPKQRMKRRPFESVSVKRGCRPIYLTLCGRRTG